VKNLLEFLLKRVQIYAQYYKAPEYRNWYFRQSKRLLKFRDIHRNSDCFIIGNGPSLKHMDLKPLKDYYTFGLNKIYLLFEKIDLGLSYHVAVNPLVIEQSAKEFELLSCPSFLPYHVAGKFIKACEHIYFIMTGGTHRFDGGDIIKEICEGYTVTYVAMQIAYYMGFSRVFLIGVDHNYNFSGNPNEERLLTGEDTNHFDARYFGNHKWHNPDLPGSELSFQMARFYFERAGRSIYDATVDGKLSIFPKISYEQALATCQTKQHTILH